MSGATLTVASGVIVNVGDDFNNNGTLVADVASTFNFTGSANQSIEGSSSSTFGNVTINKSSISNNVNITTDATILGTLTLTSGKLVVGLGKTLSIGNTSTNGTISAGSSNSYIVANGTTSGTLKRFVNSPAAYNLPIGDASKFTPMTFTLGSATLSSAYITAYTKPASVPTINASMSNYLNRYWDLTPSGITGTISYEVSYTYDDADIHGVETNFFPVKKSGTNWYKPTNSAFTAGIAEGTGSVVTGTNTLTWSGLSTFSMFSAAGDQIVNLPIDLLSFDAKKQNQNNLLFWSTATETNSDYFAADNSSEDSVQNAERALSTLINEE